ncbi:WD40-like beta Propeller containing protein [Crinalium epipsammum PCC 9333]|uniref:WD40-like beta Propeller containing protein n=1 Tax=Crinalium epipsammum PCC 9333 TaxID=1173022 RepID=K9W0M8_9CYAN|nr:TolB family protein [Crinalium epipsammum]AFZ13344.1 WD40-like beta Propeller containing protein [Crinalium epipsammum PCC 9333]
MNHEKALNIVNKSNFFVFRLDNSRFILFLSVIIAGLLSSCTASSRLLNFPFDPGGRSLNSPGAELKPQIADRYIVFISDRRGRQDVYLFDALEQRLVDLPGLNSLDAIADDPSVSEDGRYIVFTANRQGKSGIYLYDRELRQLRNLTENIAAEVRNPTISADGSAIAFESSANGQWDIVIYDRAGQAINVPTYIP